MPNFFCQHASNAPAQGAQDFLGRTPTHDPGGETIARTPSYPWADVPSNAEAAASGGEEEDEINAS